MVNRARASVRTAGMDRDAVRGQVLLEESREAVVVLDQDKWSWSRAGGRASLSAS